MHIYFLSFSKPYGATSYNNHRWNKNKESLEIRGMWFGYQSSFYLIFYITNKANI